MKNLLLFLFFFLFILNALIAKDYYVTTLGNDLKGDGSKQKPFETISKALSIIKANKNNTLHIGSGLFRIKKQIIVPSGVNLIGEGIENTFIRCENYSDIEKNQTAGLTWQISPVINTNAQLTATLIFNGTNQQVKGINFDGVNKKVTMPILIIYGKNFSFDSIYCHDFKVAGWWLHQGKNVTLCNSKFKNNSFGNPNQDYGAVMFHRADDLFIHNNLIDESDTQSYGIKMASKDQCNMWSCEDGWAKNTVNENINIFNNIIKVAENGSWKIPESPESKIPTFAIEFNSNIECNAKIFNNWVNNVISIVSGETGQKTSYEVYNNMADLRKKDGSLNKYAYFIEINEEHFNIHHNIVVGGYYPLASFDNEKVRNKDVIIHHNIFYGPDGGQERLHFFPLGSGFDSLKFYNNTVIDVNNVGKIFSVQNPNRCNTNCSFINNIFYSFSERGDILGDSCAVNGIVDNNLFYNIKVRGKNSMNFNPLFTFKGLVNELMYFSLKPESKAIDAGLQIKGYTNTFKGKMPDLGALEYGAIPFKVGVVNYTGPDSENDNRKQASDHYRQISWYDYKDKVEGSWIAQANGALFGYDTEAKWTKTYIPFEFDGFPKFNLPLLVKIWDEEKTFEKVLVAMDKYKNIKENWDIYEPKSMLDQDELYLEFLFLYSIQKYGLNVTSLQMAQDWVKYLNPSYVWSANSDALQNFRKGILPPASGMPNYNKSSGAIDFQIESELFGLISPGMPRITSNWAEKAGQLMAYQEGLDAGKAIALITSEAFFENDPVKLMKHAINLLPDSSKYAEMMKTIIDLHTSCPTWQELWTKIQDKRWRKTDLADHSVLIEGAYAFIGLLYSNGDIQKAMNIATRCGEDSDCNPSTTAGIIGAFTGISKMQKKWQTLRHLPIENNAIDQIYSKFINWDEIINTTLEIGKWNILQNGGYIENGIIFIPIP